MKLEGVPFEPYVTKMIELKPGIQFKETIAGWFSLEETDPKAGKHLGKQAATKLAMHAQVDIDQIDLFVADKNHPGQLSGTIDFAPIGMGMPSQSGVFNLFYPTEDPKMKLIVYELGFSHQGKHYYLAGKKEVRDDPGFDLWSDTTTLFTQLHQGTDKSGTVIGAGILTLGVTNLIKLVSTIKVLNTDSSTDKIKTISTFGRFFMGELWDTYVKHV
jgi:hypothetical protein